MFTGICGALLFIGVNGDSDFPLLFTPNGLTSGGWANEGTLGSDYDIGSLNPGTVQTVDFNGEDINALCFENSEEVATMDFDMNQPEITITAWVRTDYLHDFTFLLSSDDEDGGWERGFFFKCFSSDCSRGIAVGGTGNCYTSTLGHPPIGEWIYVAATWSVANDEAVIYLNGGDSAGGQQQTRTSLGSATSSYTITGINRSWYTHPSFDPKGWSFNGCFARIRAAYRVLSAGEVASDYDASMYITGSPSPAPTEECRASLQYNANWHDLLNSNEQNKTLLKTSSVNFDATTLSLTVSATVEYVGYSSDGNFNDDPVLGTSYYMDFQSFTESDGGIASPGTCANRRLSDYSGLTFGQFWNFPVNPLTLDTVDITERMAYPPSDWDLQAIDCNEVVYERTFSWTELASCADATGNALISITETDDEVLMKGTFFVVLVSPYSTMDTGYYRTSPLVQQDFQIALSRQVDVLASTETQLFISSVMAYGRDENGTYELTMLIQSADYVELGMDEAVTPISSPLPVSSVETVTDGCLVASAFTCGQIFTATIPAQCSGDADDVDLSGTYQFAFSPRCRGGDGDTAACEVFMSTLNDDGKVVLDVDSSFIDDCEVDYFAVDFSAEMTFYTDVGFTVEADGSAPFVIGQDEIFGKVSVSFPDEIDFLDASIENVYVCTAPDTIDMTVDPTEGTGGCLSSNIDADGPYIVVGDGADTQYQGSTDYDVTADNEAAFSFLTFATARETIHVHVQVMLTVDTPSGTRRRRMLLQSGSNQFRSFIGSATVQEAPTTAEPVETDGGYMFSVICTVAVLIVSTALI